MERSAPDRSGESCREARLPSVNEGPLVKVSHRVIVRLGTFRPWLSTICWPLTVISLTG